MTISRLDAILKLGAVVLAAVALAMLVAPAALGSLFGVDSSSGGDFLARRYGASGMAALAFALWMAPGNNARRTVLAAMAVWFAVQAIVVIAGLATSLVSPLGLVAAISDSFLCAVSVVAARWVSVSASDRT